MKYGKNELLYAQPFADTLVNVPEFKSWIIRKTVFATLADKARLLDREMHARRSKGAAYWWRSHYYHSCHCFGCSGKETDLLAVFDGGARRFALHIEVKHPGDGFDDDRNQAAAYPVRARCWAANAPPNVLAHGDAATALLCSGTRLHDYALHVGHFDTVFTFEEIAEHFPSIGYPPRTS